MARRSDYYDFISPGRATWSAVAYPDGDSKQIPQKTGVYRFVKKHEGDNQTLFTDTAPSLFGLSLRECFVQHVAYYNDGLAKLHDLYIIDRIEFEHLSCNAKQAKRHKNYLVTIFQPHYNMIILKITDNSSKRPFDN